MAREWEQEIKKRLLAEKKRLRERIEGMDQAGLHQSLGGSTGELSMYDNHPGDVASEVFDRSKDLALRENASLVVNAIDGALEKLEKGIYGLCEACGGAISHDRLEALPYTTLCIQCKRKYEDRPGEVGRPVEEGVLEEIYARPFDSGVENVEFDWEDSFQEVSRWDEHAVRSGAGAYYGPGELEEEDRRGVVEDVDSIPYEVGDDGVIYQSFHSVNDGPGPRGIFGRRDRGEQSQRDFSLL